jgi:hypothetical protein
VIPWRFQAKACPGRGLRDRYRFCVKESAREQGWYEKVDGDKWRGVIKSADIAVE